MSQDVSFDFSDLVAFTADLGRASAEVTRNAQKAVSVTAQKVRDEARKTITGLPHAKHYPRSISYDMHYSLKQIGAEVGPDKDGPQGALGNILEFGSVNNAPWPHLGPAMQRNEEDFVNGLRKAMDVL